MQGIRLYRKCICCIAALTACYCISGVPIASAQATAPENTLPKQEEQTLSVISITPDTTVKPTGLSEDTIHQYFSPTEKQLPANTKKTLDTISRQWQKQKQQQTEENAKPIVLQRGKTPNIAIDTTLKQEGQKTKKMDISLSTKVKNAPIMIETLQEQAYNALMAGQMEVAISLYKQSLELSPGDKLSMFGLATTYHRNKQIKQAHELYSQILATFPNDRDTFNNFLALLGDTAPQEALVELQRLEEANPDFSPIVAQIGLLYQRMGNNENAEKYLRKAVSLSPENLSYRYNLAIVFDHAKKWQEAAILYRQLIDAAKQGKAVPGDSTALSERLMFITTEH